MARLLTTMPASGARTTRRARSPPISPWDAGIGLGAALAQHPAQVMPALSFDNGMAIHPNGETRPAGDDHRRIGDPYRCWSAKIASTTTSGPIAEMARPSGSTMTGMPLLPHT